MRKLTEAQRRVLERMATGETIHTVSGINAHAFWTNMNGRNPRLDTIYCLKGLALVEEISSDWTGSHLRITPAGRALLKEVGDGE